MNLGKKMLWSDESKNTAMFHKKNKQTKKRIINFYFMVSSKKHEPSVINCSMFGHHKRFLKDQLLHYNFNDIHLSFLFLIHLCCVGAQGFSNNIFNQRCRFMLMNNLIYSQSMNLVLYDLFLY